MPGERTQRLFFALWPGAEVRLALQSLSASATPERGRTVATEDLHITLVFLGSVPERRMGCLEDAVAGISGLPSFTLNLDRLGYWRKSGILWCGPSLVPPQLSALVVRLQAALGGCGFEPEPRPYAPHVTLCRGAAPVPGRVLYPVLRWPVEDFVLVHSSGSAGPPRYRVLKKWVLDS